MTEMRALLAIARRRWLGVAALTVLGALIAAVLNLVMPLTYTATAQLFLATPDWNDSTATPYGAGTPTSYGDSFTQQRMTSYERLALTPVVTTPAVEAAGSSMSPTELAERSVVHAIPDTVILEVSVRDGSAAGSAALTNALANQLGAVIREVERPSYSKNSPVQPVLTRPATPPGRPASPRVLQNIAFGACLGLLIGLTYATLRETRPARELQAIDDEPVTVLGVLRSADLEDTGQPAGIGADARFLRVELLDAVRRVAPTAVVLTSPRASGVVWDVGAQLSLALAEVGTRAVLVLADFDAQSAGFDGPGLGDVLAGTTPLSQLLDDDASPLLLGAGTPPQNRTAALSGAGMAAVLEDLARRFDVVVVVGPAVLESTDSLDLARLAGATVLVAPPPAPDAPQLHEARRLLGLVDAEHLGTIVVTDDAETFELPEQPTPAWDTSTDMGERRGSA